MVSIGWYPMDTIQQLPIIIGNVYDANSSFTVSEQEEALKLTGLVVIRKATRKVIRKANTFQTRPINLMAD